MATYRAVVRHISYWRGVPHSWSTVYTFIGTPSGAVTPSVCNSVRTLDDRMCYGPLASDGGTYECSIYDEASGGVPIASDIAFDHTIVADWPGFSGAGWTTTGAPQLISRETALAVEWAAGLSSSGKPVILRKWYHAVPDTGTVGAAAQVGTADAASLLTAAHAVADALTSIGMVLGSGTGRFAGSATIKTMFGNHQMPRGRRRKPLVTADGRYTGPSLLIGPASAGEEGD